MILFKPTKNREIIKKMFYDMSNDEQRHHDNLVEFKNYIKNLDKNKHVFYSKQFFYLV